MAIRFLFTILFSLFCITGFAQRIQKEMSHWAENVQVDGKLNEWNDSLTYYFEDQDLQYAFSNDEQFLYVAIRVKDKQKQIQACFNGFNIMINESGKKKEGPTITFPIPNRAALRGTENGDEEVTDIREKTLNAVRAIYVRGFQSVLDGPISLDNNYGIQVAVKIDSTDNLCYESAIRLDRLNLSSKNPFAINVKINGIIKSTYNNTRPMDRRARYPYGYGGGYGYDNYPRTTTVNRAEPGIWHLLSLAVKP